MTARVALVLVSHSAELARGVAELAGQMAPDVLIRGVGGGPGGGLGTSLDAVQKAFAEVLTELADAAGDIGGVGADDAGGGVVVLGDLARR
jgi:PTS hybrid protein